MFYKLLNKIPPLYLHTSTVHHSQDSHRSIIWLNSSGNLKLILSGILSPLRLALLIFYKLFHLSPLNIQNFSTEVSISFVQRNVRVALAAWSVCRAQNNEGEFFSIFSINIWTSLSGENSFIPNGNCNYFFDTGFYILAFFVICEIGKNPVG